MIAFVPEKPAPRKCKIGCQSPFPRVGYIRREKLFKYAYIFFNFLRTITRYKSFVFL